MAAGVLPDEQIAAAAYAAGFRGDDLPIVVAIAIRESGGRPTAHNSRPPDDSYGLMQINYYGSLRAPRTAAFGPPEGLYDPEKNMQAAFAISGQGKSFKPWTTYTSFMYRLDLPRAYRAVAQFQVMTPGVNVQHDPDKSTLDHIVSGVAGAAAAIGGGAIDAGQAAVDLATAPLKGIEAVGAFFMLLTKKDTWWRVAEVLGGSVLVLVGIALVNRDAIAQAGAAVGTGGASEAAGAAAGEGASAIEGAAAVAAI